jgi:hypothetical protein
VALSDSIESVDFVSESHPDRIQEVVLFATFYADNENASGDEEHAEEGNPEDPGEAGRERDTWGGPDKVGGLVDRP